MPAWLEFILDIIKITIPAAIVGCTAFYLIKKHLDNEFRMRQLELKQAQQGTTTPLRLQAYERLSMFCERISIPSLMLRVRGDAMTAAHLRMAMLISIQKEFEHNITQQVYVSDSLWKIVKIARDDTVYIINKVYSEVPDPEADSRDYSRMLLEEAGGREVAPLSKALEAVKREAGILL